MGHFTSTFWYILYTDTSLVKVVTNVVVLWVCAMFALTQLLELPNSGLSLREKRSGGCFISMQGTAAYCAVRMRTAVSFLNLLKPSGWGRTCNFLLHRTFVLFQLYCPRCYYHNSFWDFCTLNICKLIINWNTCTLYYFLTSKLNFGKK